MCAIAERFKGSPACCKEEEEVVVVVVERNAAGNVFNRNYGSWSPRTAHIIGTEGGSKARHLKSSEAQYIKAL